MGSFRDLLSRWLGKPGRADGPAAGRPRRVKQPRPGNVRPLEEGSPMVVFTQGEATVIMDRDAFDYTYGDADSPDPAQADLDELWPRLTRVCVLSGALYGGRAMGGDVLLDTDDPGALRELADCLRVVEDTRTFGHCACLGGPTLELYAGPELLATLGLQHGKAIRWARWYHDARLRDGGRLRRWLTGRGVGAGLLESIDRRGNDFLFGREEPASDDQRRARELAARARSRARAGQMAEALEDCNRSLAIAADADTCGLRGLVHYQLQELEAAAADCSEAIRRGLRQAEVYFTRGVACDHQGHAEQAHADFSMAIHLEPGHAGAHNSRALVRARLGRADEALADLAEAIRLAPDWFLPYLTRAQMRQQRGDHDGVLADCADVIRVLERAPGAPAPGNLAAAYLCRGHARVAREEPVAARDDYDRALDLAADCVDALNARGWLHFREGRTDLALADFDAVVRLAGQQGGWGLPPPGGLTIVGPVRPGAAYAQRASARLQMGEWERALEDLDEATRRDPEAGYVYGLRGQVYLSRDRHDEALADFGQAIRWAPEDPTAYLARARLHARRGEYQQQQDDLRAVLSRDPQQDYACNSLAWLLATCPDARFRDGARAVELATRACDKTGWTNHHHLDTLAAACAEAGRFDQACGHQERALALLPEGDDQGRYRARLEQYRAGQPHRDPGGVG
jgi:tetratricopeptide (TPR) repeat protein